MHPAGFEPATSLRKWIMSPPPSTTWLRMQKEMELMGFEPMCIKIYVDSKKSQLFLINFIKFYQKFDKI